MGLWCDRLRGENILKDTTETKKQPRWHSAMVCFIRATIGYRDADGFFYIVDRKSDLIIRGGENIYPRETISSLSTSCGGRRGDHRCS